MIAVLTAAMLIPTAAGAKVDPSCSPTTATSAIAGKVANALGAAQEGVLVELYRTNDARAIAGDRATTSGSGTYRICAGEGSGAGHDTYDVHVQDTREHPLYATANQPYSTFTNLTGDADFTPASGHPLLYLTNLKIDPAEISTATGPATVTWTVRSKAPASTTMMLHLGHNGRDEQLDPIGAEAGGPAAGGWNVWATQDEFVVGSAERLYWSTIRGTLANTQVTQLDHQPYVIDNKAPLFGLATSSLGQCGPGVYANPFSPAAPGGTTNPQSIVVHGVCDAYSDGARSGIDPFSLTGKQCSNAAMTSGCKDIFPVLSSGNIVWWPQSPLALGSYWLRWTMADKAGNTATSLPEQLLITDRGGQKPVINAVQPGNLGSGSTGGIVVGSAMTTPTSIPYVGFRVTDADGQTDLVPGSLQVKVYFGDERTLVYSYDPTMTPNQSDPVSGRGGATFDLSSGIFRATGFSLQGQPPGRYIASASISDHGGNGATMTWHWLLVAAA
jgi:hypothetical protein